MRHQKLIILFSLLITACSGSQNTPTAELNTAQDATQKVEGANPTQPIPETQKVEGSNPTQQAPTFNPKAYDVQCADNILGMEVTDQIFPELCAEECRNPTEVELEQIEACRSGVPLGSHDDGGQEAPVYSQRELSLIHI